MNTRHTLALLLILAPTPALAKDTAIQGQVLDRNGQPIEKVNVSVDPGHVEIITDQYGNFRIDYLRDEQGNRIKLAKKANYTVSFFKVGYNEATATLSYKRGVLQMEQITLIEDSIRLENSAVDIDPGSLSDPAQNAGGSYEGE